MKSFFFDTADVSYIENAWEKISNNFRGIECRGVTTNPNAMMKIQIKDIGAMQSTVNKLCRCVSHINPMGVVYVQYPSSSVNPTDLIEFAKRIQDFSDCSVKVGLKIPPFFPILQVVDKLSSITEVNVTGVADCSTALLCFTYDVRYVSVIPGRMEEKGIDADAQLLYINQRKRKYNSEIITGSMRTIDGLKRAILCDTVPTIGTKVFDAIFAENKVEEVSKFWDTKIVAPLAKFSPLITQDMTDLSTAFFDQMDNCGKDFQL